MTDAEWVEWQVGRAFPCEGGTRPASRGGAGRSSDGEFGDLLHELAVVDGTVQIFQRRLALRVGTQAARGEYGAIERIGGLSLSEFMRASRAGVTTLVPLTLVLAGGSLSLSMPLSEHAALISFLERVTARFGGRT